MGVYCDCSGNMRCGCSWNLDDVTNVVDCHHTGCCLGTWWVDRVRRLHVRQAFEEDAGQDSARSFHA